MLNGQSAEMEFSSSPPSGLPSKPQKQRTPQTQSFWAWLALGLGLNVILAATYLLHGEFAMQMPLVMGLLSIAIPAATAHLAFISVPGRFAKVPRLLGWSSLAFAGSQALFFVGGRLHGGVKAFIWEDLVFCGCYPLLMAAMLWWPSLCNPPSQRFRNFIDLFVGAAGLWAAAWVFVIGPEMAMNRRPPAMELFTIGIPILGLLLVVCVFQMVRRNPDPRFAPAARLLLLALSFIILSDGAFAWYVIQAPKSPAPGWILQLAWPLSCTLTNLAAYLFVLEGRREQPIRVEEPEIDLALTARPWYSLVPYALIPGVALLMIYAVSHPEAKPFESGIVLGSRVMVVCLLIRQVLAIRDNNTLLTRLQLAYAELKSKNTVINQTNNHLQETLQLLKTNNVELTNANAQLAQLVTIDGMTGLENHRAFQQHLRVQVEAAKHHHHPLSLIMADVDYFKRYNDEFGHPAGDDVLRQIAKLIIEEVGEKAYPARYGGEEFAVILPYLTAAEAILVSERVGRAISTRLRAKRRITISCGVAALEPSWNAESLVSEADRALYAAKNWGRNRTVLVTDLDRQRLSLDILDEGMSEFDPNEPMGLAAVLSAGLRNHPQALGIEPDSQLAGGLLGTLELKDVETRDHSERVMWYAMRLAQSVIESEIGAMTQQELRCLAYGALLHDMGKIGVPETILKFPGRLDLEMKGVIREHPRLGAQIVQRFPTLDLALSVIKYHHEQWDGRGYPFGLRGVDIPLVARIFTVVDGLEAMTSKRPYSDPISIESVTERLLAESGTMYDPAILRAFTLVPKEEWVRIRQRETSLAEQIGQVNAIAV